MGRSSRKELIVGWALQAGFDRAGVAGLGPSRDGEALRRWLAEGHHAGMAYMARGIERRLDPASSLPGARSALCVALQYHPLEGEPEPAGDLWPRVARYARGRDYHEIMLAGLRGLAARIAEAFPGTACRPYVDTGPLLERELAARAGLGAVGKNTNLLHPEGGSWFLLGELLLTLELEPDQPLADLCGSCTRCLEACPTGALPEPYVLDSSRCISYWTIEHRGAVPEPARRAMEAWVFGCDVCQEVCPWNTEAATADHRELRLPEERRELDLAGLLSLEREGYVERFRGSPMKRAKLGGLRRNAAVAMGNRADPAYRRDAARALGGNDPIVRRHAAWALGEIGGEASVRLLDRALAAEPDPGVRREIARALHHQPSQTATGPGAAEQSASTPSGSTGSRRPPGEGIAETTDHPTRSQTDPRPGRGGG